MRTHELHELHELGGKGVKVRKSSNFSVRKLKLYKTRTEVFCVTVAKSTNYVVSYKTRTRLICTDSAVPPSRHFKNANSVENERKNERCFCFWAPKWGPLIFCQMSAELGADHNFKVYCEGDQTLSELGKIEKEKNHLKLVKCNHINWNRLNSFKIAQNR